MKKIIVLFVLALGMMSFSSSTTVEKKEYSISADSSESNFSIETNIVGEGSCTATVYYNGMPVKSFTVKYSDESFIGMACQLAMGLAEQYIEENS